MKTCSFCYITQDESNFGKNGKAGLYATCKICKKIKHHQYRERIKKIVFDHYGQECTECHIKEKLEINHINGNGKDHRESLYRAAKMTGINFWIWLIKNKFPDGFNVLCADHNKRYKP